ncbi:MAG: T9SS type A sorting domain-containing protein [Candidatus Delongbacteria bacterium]|nr:T9SS type A sorting domain-containing protein [Candidatus Delongbacteria bacterium]
MKLNYKIVIFLLIFVNAVCYSQFAGGSGIIADPWQISNVEQLQLMKDNLSSHFILINDIDASATSGWNDGSGFIPIGSGTYNEPSLNFKGSLNGSGYTISNLYIKYSDSKYLGLFGSLEYDAVVENVSIVDAYVEGKNETGGLVGENNGTIINCSFSGVVNGTGTMLTGGWNTGGLVGQNFYGSVLNSFSSGEVSGYGEVGGLVGDNTFGTVTNCNSSVNVSGNSNIGGVIGSIFEGTIVSSYSTGIVEGNRSVGGLIGYNSKGIISNSFYNVDSVQINGGNYITIGGIYNEQYNDWFTNGLNLNIENYSTTIIPAGGYYSINSIEGLRDLLGFSGNEGYKFKLENSLDLSGVSNLYIPYLVSEFDGDNHIISNLNIDLSFGSMLGMFGYSSSSGIIKNCVISNAYINGRYYVGGLVGKNYGTIHGSNIQGTVNGTIAVGGLIGDNYGDISNSYTEINIYGSSGQSGGLVGGNEDGGTITNSYAKGMVSGDDWFVGGLAAENWGSIDSSFADVEVSSTSRSPGGFVGSNWGTIANSYSTGNVNCTADYAGGFVAENYDSISCSYSIGNVSGNSYVGGFVGNNYFGDISNSYTKGNVVRISSSTSTNIGGFAGNNYKAKINNCYSTGSVQYEDSENPIDKGFCGFVIADSVYFEMLGNYWDIETSNQTTTSGDANGRTTVDMTQPYSGNTYVDWDFIEVWAADITWINDGYPVFIWTSGIEENEDEFSALIKGFELYQNYPNPFNPVTKIKFDLSKTAVVKLSVYNVKGQFVSELVNGTKNTGRHVVEFDGSKLNSGIYYYALEVDGKSLNRKMIILK